MSSIYCCTVRFGSLFLPNSGFHWLHLHCACVDIIARCLPCHHFSFRNILGLPTVAFTRWESSRFFFFFNPFAQVTDVLIGANGSFFFSPPHVLVSYWATRLCYFSLLIALLSSSQCLPWRRAADTLLLCFWYFCTSVVSNSWCGEKKLLCRLESIVYSFYMCS